MSPIDFETLSISIESGKASSLDRAFNQKLTENGDSAYKSTGNIYLDIFAMLAYFEKHLDAAKIGDSDVDKIFACFIRDPRHGLGRRDLGRHLMKQAGVDLELVPVAGRYDDLYAIFGVPGDEYTAQQALAGNALAKKWLPRETSGTKSRKRVEKLCKKLNITPKIYRKNYLAGAPTTEHLLNSHVHNGKKREYNRRLEIDFEKVPSLARIRWAKTFRKISHYREYLNKATKGEAKVAFSVGTPYDVYSGFQKELIQSAEVDLLWNALERPEINCIPVIDVSGSMWNDLDCLGKAISIGMLLSEATSYCKNQFVTFDSEPRLVTLDLKWPVSIRFKQVRRAGFGLSTDLGKVMKLFSHLDDWPTYVVVLSDMEFDEGSNSAKSELMAQWKSRGIPTKIVWWNFNTRETTFPETDELGNLFISGYSPTLLDSALHDSATTMLAKKLEEYAAKLKCAVEAADDTESFELVN